MKKIARLSVIAATAMAAFLFVFTSLALAQGPAEETRTTYAIPAGGGVVTHTLREGREAFLVGVGGAPAMTVTLQSTSPFSYSVAGSDFTPGFSSGGPFMGPQWDTFELPTTVRGAVVDVVIEAADAAEMTLVDRPAKPVPTPTPVVTPTVTAEQTVRVSRPLTLTAGVPYSFTATPVEGEQWIVAVPDQPVTVTVKLASAEPFGFGTSMAIPAGSQPAELAFYRQFGPVTTQPIVTTRPGQVITVSLTADGNTTVDLVVDRPATAAAAAGGGSGEPTTKLAPDGAMPQTSAADMANGGNPEEMATTKDGPPLVMVIVVVIIITTVTIVGWAARR